MSSKRFSVKNSLRIIAQALFVVAVIYAFGRLVIVSFDSRLSGDIPVYLQNVSDSAISLRWHSSATYPARVVYGQQPDSLTHVVSEAAATGDHRVRLKNLQAGQRYYYAIYNGNTPVMDGPSYWFVTAPKPGSIEPLRIWITGDQGQAGDTQTKMRDAMITWTGIHARPNKPNIDLWLTTGDNAYRSGSVEQFKRHFFTPFNGILRNIPVYPAYGNHDARRWSFFRLFEFPAEGEAGGVASGSEHYYSLDYGNAHIVMLDSTVSSMAVDSPMYNWLKKDLATSKQTWLLTVLHHPPYTHGSHNSDNPRDSGGRMQQLRENIVPLLEQHGLDMMISGHSHGYERSWFMLCNYKDSSQLNRHYIQDRGDTEDQKQMIYRKRAVQREALSGGIYMVMGSSARAEDGPYDHPAMPVSIKQAGSMVLDINANKLVANFLATDFTIKDRFTIVKGDKTALAPKTSCDFTVKRPRSYYY